MRILLTGKTGQIGYELERSLISVGEVFAPDRRQMDLTDTAQVREVIRMVKPDLIVNAAAYTDVRSAELDPAAAMQVNAVAPAVMAEEAKRLGASIIHYSTDYVFDGTKSTPYLEGDIPCPINHYGRSKLEGERAIADSGIPHWIIRTSWIYGMRGNNFLLTILRLAREKETLEVVNDQFGAPTWCRTVVLATKDALQGISKGSIASSGQLWPKELSGIYHLTAQGCTTWYGFARLALELTGTCTALLPIGTPKENVDVKRPLNSVLNCERWAHTFGKKLQYWQVSAQECLFQDEILTY